ncbi:MAG: hypothetical protein JWQ87_5245 [Candidatus Sulfotelmatobacter sp.]|nr:hypothetical protein [Candidatus Sulfotelmatobacter sp.]
MRFLTLQAYAKLILIDLYIANGNFHALYQKVRNCPTATVPVAPHAVERVCHAIDIACIWYWKEVLCLQRSAATVCLLRKYGVSGEMIIGTQQSPFKSHAWAEVDGRVVNDKPYMQEMYAVVDRC